MKNLLLLLFIAALCISCTSVTGVSSKNPKLITVKDGKFFKGDQPYYFVGANYWYGPLIAAKDEEGRKRLIKELDVLKENGINNLRILAGAEGGTNDYTVSPALQYEQGKYDKKLLKGLDFLLSEMRKRNMYAVLYMNNNWEWSGGMAQYLSWNGYGDVPIPNVAPNTWKQFMDYTKQFHTCEPCKEAYRNHIRFMMGRINSVTGIKYTNDNTIMSWQVANEPRVFDEEHESDFTKWLHETVTLIDSLDSKHLISTGSEGAAGSLLDIDRFERTHDNPKIDYLTMHMWPKNWRWYEEGVEGKSIKDAIVKANEYMENHIELAKKVNKPIVMSEFGVPRAGESFSPTSNTDDRDEFYDSMFSLLVKSYENQGVLGGYNFWGFGGFGKSANRENGKWEKGDDFTADPPQEPQGFNTVFSSDTTTLNLIKKYNQKVGNLK